MTTQRSRWRALVVSLAFLVPGCGSSGSRARDHLDLGGLLDQAELRPAGAPFALADVVHDGRPQPALSVPANSRITWEIAIPDRAVLLTGVAFPAEGWTDGVGEALFRIGVSDNRVYEELQQTSLAAHAPSSRRWMPVTVDLSRYGGFKWSLFYRPRSVRWKVILNTGVTRRGSPGAAADRLLWMRPAIVAR